MTAPDRIWVDENGSWCEINRVKADTSYIRADLIPAMLAAEREKALREALINPRHEHLEAACEGVNCYPSELEFILERYCDAVLK